MIKNIIFDLGRVLINWDLEKFAKNYTSNKTLQKHIVEDIFTHSDWHTLDCGIIDEETAETRFATRLNLPVSEIKKIIHEARKIMTLKEDTYEQLKRLSNKYKIFCLSNMSHKSWDVILETHTFHKYFIDIIISAQEKLIKPDKKIFTTAIKRFNIKPEETIFIDDLEENIRSAKSVGINGILFDESELCWNSIKSL